LGIEEKQNCNFILIESTQLTHQLVVGQIVSNQVIRF